MKIRKAYKDGDNTGINLPAEYGIRPGTHMTVERVGKKIVLKRLIN